MVPGQIWGPEAKAYKKNPELVGSWKDQIHNLLQKNPRYPKLGKTQDDPYLIPKNKEGEWVVIKFYRQIRTLTPKI